MSTEIPSPYIVLSSDYRRVQGIIDGTISLNQDSTHDIILKGDHTNFISLTHNFNFSNKGGNANSAEIHLELLDPDNRFNERFIFASLNQMITGRVHNTEFDVANINYDNLRALQDRAEKAGEFGYLENLTDISTTLSSLPYDPGFVETMEVGADIAKAVAKGMFTDDVSNLLRNKLMDHMDLVAQDIKKQRDILLAKNKELKEKVQLQLDLIKRQLSNPTIYILYGIGTDLNAWAGPFICSMSNVDYRFNGSNGARSLVLTFIPMGDITIFTGDNVLSNGLGVLNTKDGILPVKINIFEEVNKNKPGDKVEEYFKHISEDLDQAKAARLFRNTAEVRQKDVDLVVNTLIYNYVKNAVIDTDVIVILPDLNKVVSKQLNYLSSIAYNYVNEKYWSPYNIGSYSFVNAYAYLELYKSLGFHITKFGTFNTEKFIGGPLPENFIENFDGFLGKNYKYSETAVSLIKLPSQTYKEPLDELARNLSDNGRPIDFEMEVIHDKVYLQKLSKYLRSKGNTKVSGNRPLLVVGDRSMIEKFLYGKKSLETEGLIKYVGSPNSKESVSLEGFLTEETKVFSDPEYQQIAKETFLSFPTNPYNFSKLPKDSFHFIDADKSEELLKSTGTTILVMGTEESNILDINTNINLSYYMALQQIWFSETMSGRFHTGSKDIKANVSPNDVGIQDVKAAIAALSSEDATSIADKVNKYKDRLAQELHLSNQDIESITSFLINILSANKSSRNINIPVDWISGDNTFQQLVRLIVTISRLANQATVKTLPAFHLSKSVLCLPTVLMILKEPGIINRSNDYSVLTSMSGFWKVIGFQHRISAYDISSSFQLVKDLSNGLPILNTLDTKTKLQ